ncbi:SDR family oxidoreductase [Myxococcota bacterium]|nr:SDR family oxidoreductase [Myxococcota bacterium]
MTRQVAIVTGAGSGIGRAITQRLATDGWLVHAVDRNLDAARATSALCPEGAVVPLELDVADLDAYAAAFAHIPVVHALLANAGICRQATLADDFADEVWRTTMRINVDAVWQLFRTFHDRLADGGRAVITSSGLGKLGRPGYGAYVASKHAVLGLTKCFSRELAPRAITVNAICPGWVDTPMARGDLVKNAVTFGTTPEIEYERACEAIALHRFVQPEEIAALVAFLLSPGAGAITGEAYNISCGEFFA